MPKEKRVLRRLLARLTPAFWEDWSSSPGRRLRETMLAIDEFAKESRLNKNLEAPVDLAWRAAKGAATEKHAEALRSFAEAENVKIEQELQRRTLESRVRKEAAEADKAEAELALARVRELEARIELLKRLNELGVGLEFRPDGTFIVHPTSASDDFNELFSKERNASSD
jgi:hypothetical protein